jgi:peroxiredoxin
MVLLGYFFLCAAVRAQPYVWEKQVQPPLKAAPVFTTVISEEERQYLGIIPHAGSFTLSDIKASVLVVEIFDMYCPHCQRAAGQVNRLYKLIAERGLAGKIKIIGIGRGNSAFEVGTFREKYRVPFPLLADEDGSRSELFSYYGTPYFLGIALHKDGSFMIFLRHAGPFGDAQGFLDELIKKTGIDDKAVNP